jgi:hypothetical protein
MFVCWCEWGAGEPGVEADEVERGADQDGVQSGFGQAAVACAAGAGVVDHVEPLPGYAPELNPVEQCWAWIKNGPLANYCAANLNDLTDAAGHALDRLRKRPELLAPFLRHTGLDWA